ncbi:MAG: TolC family protein [Trichloromonadaceae bacterium]
MHVHPSVLISLLLLSLAAARPLQAEPVDLPTVLRSALSARPFAQAASAEAEAAAAAVGEAKSRYLPRLTLSENFQLTDEPGGSLFIALNQQNLQLSPSADPYNFPPSRRDFETRLTLDQPLFDLEIGYGRKRAEKAAEAAQAAASWSGEEAAFAGFRAYLQLQQADGAQAWAVSSRQLAEEVHRLAEERRASGVGLKADALQAAVALAEARQREASAASDQEIARLALALAMGRSGGELRLAAPITPELFAQLPNPQPGARADLSAMARQSEAAELAYRQSRSDYLPRAGLSASYALHDSSVPFGAEAESYRLMAGLRWELFDGLRRSKASEVAAANQRSAQLRSLEATRQAGFDLEEAKARAAVAQLNLQTARQAALQAEEGRRLLQERYAAGLSELAELLAAQAALDRARFGVVEGETRLLLGLGAIRFQSGQFVQSLLPAEEIQP